MNIVQNIRLIIINIASIYQKAITKTDVSHIPYENCIYKCIQMDQNTFLSSKFSTENEM